MTRTPSKETLKIQIKYLEKLIFKLEERIIALERKESVVHILPTDNYYWEHG